MEPNTRISDNPHTDKTSRHTARRKRESSPHRVLVRLQWRASLRPRQGRVASVPRDSRVERGRRDREAERGPDLADGLEERAAERLLVPAADLGGEERAGREDEVGAEDTEDDGGEAERPVGKCGVDHREEEARDPSEECADG